VAVGKKEDAKMADPVKPSGVVMYRICFKPHIIRSALKVSLVVGIVLNLVNNGEQLWTQHSVNLWHVAMNFVVPYLVSTYSAARNEARRSQGG